MDGVYEQLGPDLWPDKYDFRRDGTQRLNSQLDSGSASPTANRAGLWKEMTELTGDAGVAAIFAAWGKAKVDEADPEKALKTVLQESRQGQELAEWWDRAEESLVVKRPKSGFRAETLPADQLDGEIRELAHDDSQQAGKNSSAGGGQAVRFESGPGAQAYLTSVRIHGSRYGRPTPPQKDFRVWQSERKRNQLNQCAQSQYEYRANRK